MKGDVEKFLAAQKKLSTGRQFDAKTVQLMGLAASVGMKCEYCILAHTAFAKKVGATEEEIKYLVLIGSNVAFGSTMLYGHSYYIEALKKMLGM